MKLAIHQPNFFPWYPYYHKMKSCDKFVLLTHCQYEKNNYQNRFQLQGKWYTCRIDSSSGSKATIREKKYVDFVADWNKIKESIPQHYVYIMDLIDMNSASTAFKYLNNSVYRINAYIIRRCQHIMNINTEMVYDMPTYNTGTERLIEICLSYGASEYLSGPSGMKYMDMELWDNANIGVSCVSECMPYERVSMIEYIHNELSGIHLSQLPNAEAVGLEQESAQRKS